MKEPCRVRRGDGNEVCDDAAHGTLQPVDESTIVGYYTFAKVRPLGSPSLKNTKEVDAYGKK